MSKGRLALYSVALILQIYKFFKIYFGRQKYRKLQELIGKLMPLTPSQIIQKLKSSSIATSIQLCKGKIFSSQPIFSFFSPSLKVLTSHLIEGNYGSGKRIINKRQPSYFTVKDDNCSLNIYQIHKLIAVHTNIMRKVKTSLWGKIRTFFESVVKAKDRSFSLLSQFFEGDNVYEAYLPEGQNYTILAKFTKQSGEICSFQPLIMTSNLNRMFQYLQSMMLKKSMLLSGFVIGAIICISLIFRHLKKMYIEYRLKNEGFLSGTINSIFVKTRICTICCQNLSCILNKPCNHMLTCQRCVPHGSACLECSEPVKEEVQYFVS